MKNILLIFALIITGLSIKAQAPQSFNYQAVVRNNMGNILPNQNVSFQISILQGSLAGSAIYTETHSATTDAMGIISLQIGNGNPTLGSFSSINWANSLYFLKIELDPLGGNNFQLSGTSQLLSVPYALYAENVANTDWIKNGNNINNSNTGNVGIGTSTPNSKLEVKGSGDTLFQVKDANGNPVFIVFPEGVRVIVKEGAVKGNLGGFAVSGRSASKTTTYEDVLLVTPDSTRVFVNQNAKGNLGGFAVSGRSASKGLSAFTHLVPDNYFIGHQAGKSLTTGKFNSFIGFESGYNNQVGSKNYFIGYRAGYNNLNGASNIFIGDSTGFNNNAGYRNIFIGNNAGGKSTTSSFNIFIGDSAGYNTQSTVGNNLFLGTNAGTKHSAGFYNIFMGNYAGYSSVTSNYNVMIGFKAGYSITTSANNVFLGSFAGTNNKKGSNNTFIGSNAGINNIGDGTSYNGELNTFIGTEAGYNNKKGSGNVYIGVNAARNSNNNNNIAIGYNAAFSDTSGIGNVYIGNNSSMYKKNGNSNIIIGFQANSGHSSTVSNIVVIGKGAANFKAGTNNVYLGAEAGYSGSQKNDTGSVFIGYRAAYNIGSNQKHKLYISTDQGHLIYGEFDNKRVGINNTAPTQTLDVGGNARFRAIATGTTGLTALYITANGTLSTSASDIRLKENVTPLTNSILNKVLKVQGVNFTWKSDSTHKKCIGFIAQEMEKVFPELVFTNQADGFKGINYSEYTAVLNEAIKEQHQTIENQKQEIEQLKLKVKEIDELKIKNKQLEELILKEINSLKSQIKK